MDRRRRAAHRQAGDARRHRGDHQRPAARSAQAIGDSERAGGGGVARRVGAGLGAVAGLGGRPPAGAGSRSPLRQRKLHDAAQRHGLRAACANAEAPAGLDRRALRARRALRQPESASCDVAQRPSVVAVLRRGSASRAAHPWACPGIDARMPIASGCLAVSQTLTVAHSRCVGACAADGEPAPATPRSDGSASRACVEAEESSARSVMDSMSGRSKGVTTASHRDPSRHRGARARLRRALPRRRGTTSSPTPRRCCATARRPRTSPPRRSSAPTSAAPASTPAAAHRARGCSASPATPRSTSCAGASARRRPRSAARRTSPRPTRRPSWPPSATPSARALGTLAARDRELIALKYHADLSNAEIAEVLGVSVSNAGTLLQPRHDQAPGGLRCLISRRSCATSAPAPDPRLGARAGHAGRPPVSRPALAPEAALRSRPRPPRRVVAGRGAVATLVRDRGRRDQAAARHAAPDESASSASGSAPAAKPSSSSSAGARSSSDSAASTAAPLAPPGPAARRRGTARCKPTPRSRSRPAPAEVQARHRPRDPRRRHARRLRPELAARPASAHAGRSRRSSLQVPSAKLDDGARPALQARATCSSRSQQTEDLTDQRAALEAAVRDARADRDGPALAAGQGDDGQGARTACAR